MKSIVLGILLLLSIQIFGQVKVFSSNFEKHETEYWPEYNRKDSSALITYGYYSVKCSKHNERVYLIPKNSPKLDTFRVEASILADPKSSKKGTIGVCFGYHDGFNWNYMFEINNKQQFRIIGHNIHGDFALSGKKRWPGWISTKTLKPSYNLIQINVRGTLVSTLINGEEVYKSTDYLIHDEPGKNGLEVTGKCLAQCNYFAVFDLRSNQR